MRKSIIGRNLSLSYLGIQFFRSRSIDKVLFDFAASAFLHTSTVYRTIDHFCATTLSLHVYELGGDIWTVQGEWFYFDRPPPIHFFAVEHIGFVGSISISNNKRDAIKKRRGCFFIKKIRLDFYTDKLGYVANVWKKIMADIKRRYVDTYFLNQLVLDFGGPYATSLNTLSNLMNITGWNNLTASHNVQWAIVKFTKCRIDIWAPSVW